MKYASVLKSTILGLFCFTAVLADQLVLQPGLNAYSGYVNAQISGWSDRQDLNTNELWELYMNNCST